MENPGGILGLKDPGFIQDQSRITILEPNDFQSVAINSGLDDSPDHRIQPGAIPSSRQDSNSFDL
jgi:hypothetical protein